MKMEWFLSFLLYNKGLSENTIILYRKHLKKLNLFLSSVWKTLDDPENINISDIYGYIWEIGKQWLTHATCNNSINAIRSYLRYCKSSCYL